MAVGGGARLGNHPHGLGHLGVGGKAREGGEEYLADPLGIGGIVLGEPVGPAAVGGELPLDVGCREEVEALGEARRLHPLALADALPVGAAEHLEKGGGAVVARVGERDRPRPRGEIREGRARSGDDVDRIEEHLGGEPAGEEMGEVLKIVGIPLQRHGAGLVGPRENDRADETFQIVLRLPEALGQAVEEGWVRGGIGVAQIILRLDQPAAEEVLPVAVDQRPGEERVVGADEPVSQPEPGILVGGDRSLRGAER